MRAKTEDCSSGKLTGSSQGGKKRERRRKERTGRGAEAPAVQDLCAGMLSGFARAVYHRMLEYARLKPSELGFDLESEARSWKKRGAISWEGAEGSAFVEGKKEWVPRFPLELASGRRPYTRPPGQ